MSAIVCVACGKLTTVGQRRCLESEETSVVPEAIHAMLCKRFDDELQAQWRSYARAHARADFLT